jgi:hypothetical protein
MNRVPFFITGLPRSRTAWLANLFTTDRTLCFHEPLVPAASLLADNPAVRIGVSDSTLPLQFERLQAEFPTAHWLYVQRPREECFESFLRFIAGDVQMTRAQAEMFAQAFFERHQQDSAELRRNPLVRTVQFELLDDYATILSAWYHLIPEIPFNEPRWESLKDLRIEQVLKRALQRRGM